MTRCLVQPRYPVFVKGYGILSFTKNMSKDIGKNISKNLSGKRSKNLLDHSKTFLQPYKNLLDHTIPDHNNLLHMQLKLLQKKQIIQQLKQLVI